MQQPRHTVASCACGLGLGLACVACFLLLRLRQPNATCALIPSSSSSLPHHLLPHYLFPPPLPLRVTRAHLGKKHHKKGRDEVIDALDVAGAGVPDRPHVQDPAHAQAQAQAATSEPPHAQAQAAASRHVASAACCLLPAAAAPPCRTSPRPSTHTHTHTSLRRPSMRLSLSLSLSRCLSLPLPSLPPCTHGGTPVQGLLHARQLEERHARVGSRQVHVDLVVSGLVGRRGGGRVVPREVVGHGVGILRAQTPHLVVAPLCVACACRQRVRGSASQPRLPTCAAPTC